MKVRIVSSSHDELGDQGSLRIPAAKDRGTAAVALEAPAGRLGIAIALPAAAEGVVPALMADESLDIIQRIAQKDADLVGEFVRPTGAEGLQLLQEAVALIKKIKPSFLNTVLNESTS